MATNLDARRHAAVLLHCVVESDADAQVVCDGQSDAPDVDVGLAPDASRSAGAKARYESWLDCDAPKCVGGVARGSQMNADGVAVRGGPPHEEPQRLIGQGTATARLHLLQDLSYQASTTSSDERANDFRQRRSAELGRLSVSVGSTLTLIVAAMASWFT